MTLCSFLVSMSLISFIPSSRYFHRYGCLAEGARARGAETLHASSQWALTAAGTKRGHCL